MPFALSPGVTVIEKDFTSIVPAVATSIGAFAGEFQWGPVLYPVTVSSENVLVQIFGQPNDSRPAVIEEDGGERRSACSLFKGSWFRRFGRQIPVLLRGHALRR